MCLANVHRCDRSRSEHPTLGAFPRGCASLVLRLSGSSVFLCRGVRGPHSIILKVSAALAFLSLILPASDTEFQQRLWYFKLSGADVSINQSLIAIVSGLRPIGRMQEHLSNQCTSFLSFSFVAIDKVAILSKISFKTLPIGSWESGNEMNDALRPLGDWSL